MSPRSALTGLPSVDFLLNQSSVADLIARFGRPATLAAARAELAAARAAILAQAHAPDADALARAIASRLERDDAQGMRVVLNLTGTVLHTNLGRAVLAEAAIEAATEAMREAVALEFDLEEGKRGSRDDLARDLLCELTGAEDATLVNNNAAAVLIALETLGRGREAIISRGEMIEIGGSFRMPDIMARAGVKLVEVGATNRTHPDDYRRAVSEETGLIVKAHTSNYRIEGFTASVGGRDLARIAHAADKPLLHDLGSGALIDMSAYGLSKEETVREAVADGADVVTFSGDKLLGGPQVGFIVGRRAHVQAIARNPLKRALRVDKIRLAAVVATLKLYRDPARLTQRLPTLRLLARPQAQIEAQANALAPQVAQALGPEWRVSVSPCRSQIGSGALPLETLPSAALRIEAAGGASLPDLVAALRRVRRPVVGRVSQNALLLDLRCLEDDAALIAGFAELRAS